MIKLYDLNTNAPLGEITEDQLQYLVDQLEEESLEDQDYYLHRDVLDMLEEEGADPALIKILRDALGAQEEMDIRWVRE